MAYLVLRANATFKCWICDEPVSLEKCTYDQHGKPVHEQCYVAAIRLDGESRKLTLRHLYPAPLYGQGWAK